MKMKQIFFIPFLLLMWLLTSFVDNDAENRDSDKFIVVLDAGHGGHDPGNLGNGYLEKNIALNIVLKVGEILSKNPGVEVIYTRKDDTFVDLYVRGEIANKANADLFVSVHCDSHTSDAHGAGTFVLGLHANKQNFEIAKKENSVIYLEDNYESRYAEYDINSPESVIGLTIMQEEFLDQSILLAKLMQDNFSKKLKRNNRKVKQAGFIVLHQTFMPSVLIETGFLTNKSEGSYLNSRTGQSEMGRAIAEAILNYKENIKVVDIPNPAEIVSNQEEPDPVKEDPTPTKEEQVAQTVTEKTVAKDEMEAKEIKDLPKKEVALAVEAIKPPKEEAGIPEEKKEVTEMATNGKQAPAEKMHDIIFKVQILASSKDLPLRAEDFHGLNRLSKEPYKNLFRYMYGNVSTHFEAKLLKSNADAKGYTSSYIVAYKDGKRIPMPEALKYVSQ
ncbi:N-acetylmuramoyl-L-alanine amidase family protein [Spongiimicrobium sp. 2-473A-2-J]|uniref:N-acetylmuramoyl-L-alanine amidase family protein n=1 Tax=Eudoraea algarum TaxID=3417568 RepID=UPI003D359B32